MLTNMLKNSDAYSYTEGVKFDEDKLRLELIPPEVITALGEVLTYGAKKYDDRNWEKGMKWSRVYGAALRHLNAWADFNQTDYDEETKLSHLKHALTCIAFLVTYEERQMYEWDDMVL